ncbi:hypothetical protein VTN77DRAFT_2148 [Rasamsonia byssochlamydoides]|uniref:uncharacterized protein n=1 Tax=Rasamsonia byssochlamydoides TaxID=89139 RepID=UPI003743F0D9
MHLETTKWDQGSKSVSDISKPERLVSAATSLGHQSDSTIPSEHFDRSQLSVGYWDADSKLKQEYNYYKSGYETGAHSKRSSLLIFMRSL